MSRCHGVTVSRQFNGFWRRSSYIHNRWPVYQNERGMYLYYYVPRGDGWSTDAVPPSRWHLNETFEASDACMHDCMRGLPACLPPNMQALHYSSL